MFFDFDKFSSITASVYADSPYSLAEVLEVFRYYFEQYEAYTGAPHPPIRAVQIERIIREMPYIDETDKANSTMDIEKYPQYHRRCRQTRRRWPRRSTRQ